MLRLPSLARYSRRYVMDTASWILLPVVLRKVASTFAVARAWKPADADDVLPCVSPISTTLVRDSLCLVQR